VTGTTLRQLAALRRGVGDQVICDFLDLLILAPTPGALSVAMLRTRWRCSQPMVSRRLSAVAAAGLAEITPGWGAYQVHAVRRLEVGA
jgi:hypothetical protein